MTGLNYSSDRFVGKQGDLLLGISTVPNQRKLMMHLASTLRNAA